MANVEVRRTEDGFIEKTDEIIERAVATTSTSWEAASTFKTAFTAHWAALVQSLFE